MLSRFPSTVEALNDYECTSRALRHIFLCSVSVNIQRRSLQVLWVVYGQLRSSRAGRRFRIPSIHPSRNGVHGSPMAVPTVISCNCMARCVWRVGLSILLVEASPIFPVGSNTIYEGPLQSALALTRVFYWGSNSCKHEHDKKNETFTPLLEPLQDYDW